MASDIERLRAEALKRHKAANAKVTRLRRKSVEVAGTQHDPRRDAAKIAKYNTPQLLGYIEKLNQFTHRSTQFVALSEGQPLPAHEWRAYKRAERLYNAKVERHYEKVKDVHIPQRNLTVEQYDQTMRPEKVQASGRAAHRPLEKIEREPHRIASPDAVRILKADIDRKRKREYLPSEIAKQREQLNTMLDTIGSGKYKEAAAKLTDYQFDVLFNHLQMADDISIRYETWRKAATTVKDSDQEATLEDHSSGIESWLALANTIGPKPPAKPPTKRGKARKG